MQSWLRIIGVKEALDFLHPFCSLKLLQCSLDLQLLARHCGEHLDEESFVPALRKLRVKWWHCSANEVKADGPPECLRIVYKSSASCALKM